MPFQRIGARDGIGGSTSRRVGDWEGSGVRNQEVRGGKGKRLRESAAVCSSGQRGSFFAAPFRSWSLTPDSRPLVARFLAGASHADNSLLQPRVLALEDALRDLVQAIVVGA